MIYRSADGTYFEKQGVDESGVAAVNKRNMGAYWTDSMPETDFDSMISSGALTAVPALADLGSAVWSNGDLVNP
jgi:hypothetical protein